MNIYYFIIPEFFGEIFYDPYIVKDLDFIKDREKCSGDFIYFEIIIEDNIILSTANLEVIDKKID